MTLTDRYVAATVRHVPERQREEIGLELHAAIDDAVAGRIASGAPAERAEIAVLEEMGDPERLAATYRGRPLQLIGPQHYLQWKRLLVLLVSIVLPIIGVVILGAQLLAGTGFLEALSSALWAAWLVGLNLAFWVTLVFALVDRSQEKPERVERWTVKDLPEATAARITWGDTIADAAAPVLTGAFLVWQQLNPWVSSDAGEGLPLLNPSLWTFVLPALLAVMVIELVAILRRRAHGRWTMADWAVNLATNAAFVALVAVPVARQELLHRAHFDQLGWLDVAPAVTLERIEAIVLAAVAAVAVIDVVSSLRKARRA